MPNGEAKLREYIARLEREIAKIKAEKAALLKRLGRNVTPKETKK